MTDTLLADPLPPEAAARSGEILGEPVVYAAHRPARLAGPAPEPLAAHLARFGPLPPVGPRPHDRDRLLDVLHAVHLAGRGGAHFGVAAKWRAAIAAGGGGTVVANGAEGEPASAKDVALLTHRPHLVLDGLACTAGAVGSRHAVVWLHDGARQTRRALERAIAERHAARVPGPDVRIATGPAAYLSGESSAVIRALSGGPALPLFHREPGTTRGIHGLPTLVHNVETLARVGLAARRGAGYRDTTLVTVVDAARRVVLEVDPATTVAAAVARARGSVGAPQAVLLGGYGGSWLPWGAAAALPLEHRALRAAGAGLGAGVVAPLPAGACGLAVTADVVDYLARSGARQCGPCLFGLPAVAALLRDLARGDGGRGQLRRLRHHLGEVEGRGACHHPDGVAQLVRTALTTFEADVAEHVRRGRCRHRGAAAPFPIPGPAAGPW